MGIILFNNMAEAIGMLEYYGYRFRPLMGIILFNMSWSLFENTKPAKFPSPNGDYFI